MLRAYALDYTSSGDHNLPSVEFAYNNSYHANIGVAPCEALYGRQCRAAIDWNEGSRQRTLQSGIN